MFGKIASLVAGSMLAMLLTTAPAVAAPACCTARPKQPKAPACCATKAPSAPACCAGMAAGAAAVSTACEVTGTPRAQCCASKASQTPPCCMKGCATAGKIVR